MYEPRERSEGKEDKVKPEVDASEVKFSRVPWRELTLNELQ